ncbi:MAG: hypothetical protein ABSD67_18975 [Terracidiphilus sp.]|jgi:hypothetical protein
MFDAVAEFVSTEQGDSAEFMEKARALAIGVAQDYEPARLYIIRIDNWFGPKWMHFAGTTTVGRVGRFHAIGIGVHKTRLHVPPFVPSRVVEQRVFAGSEYDETVAAAPLHIECPSKQALSRRIADIDKDAAFVWISGESEVQKRGAVMVYLPIDFDATRLRRRDLRYYGSFYVGFSQRSAGWEPAMLRGVSRAELAHFEGRCRASTGSPLCTVNQ